MVRPYGQNGGRPAYVIPYVNVTEMTGFSNWGPGNFAQTTVGWRDILTDNVRSHTLKLGFEEYNAREADQQQTGAGARPTYNFNSILDFVQGFPFSETGSPVDLTTHQLASWVYARRDLYTGIFAQDDWKISSRLTLNLGIRYDNEWNLFAIVSPKLTNLLLGQGSTINQQITNATVAYTPHDYFVNHNPFAITPRVGFAWDIFGDGKTSLRGGVGMFADQPPFVQMTAQTGNPPLIFTPNVSVQQGGTPVFQYCSAPSGFNIVCPVVDTSNVTVNSSGGILINGVSEQGPSHRICPEFHIGADLRLDPQFATGIGKELDRRGELLCFGCSSPSGIDAPEPQSLCGGLDCEQGSIPGLNPNFGSMPYGTTDANSVGHFGSAMIRHQSAHGFTLSGIYTYGKALDTFSSSGSLDSGSISSTTPEIQNMDLKAQRGRADFDIRQQFSATGTWTSPSSYASPVTRNALGGWQVGGVWLLQSGLPFTVYTSASFQPVFDGSGNVIGNTGGDYNADGYNWDVPNAPSFGSHLSGKKKSDYLNGLFTASQFPAPSLGKEGALGRNTYDRPGYNNLDFTLGKSFSSPWFFGEKMKIEAKGEVINLFNRTNLNGVTSDMTSSLFGHSTSQLPARYLQLHLRASF